MTARGRLIAAVGLVAFSGGVVFCSLVATTSCSAMSDNFYHRTVIDKLVDAIRNNEENLNARLIQLEEKGKRK